MKLDNVSSMIMKFRVDDNIAGVGQRITFRNMVIDHAAESQTICPTSLKWFEQVTGNEGHNIGVGREIDPVK